MTGSAASAPPFMPTSGFAAIDAGDIAKNLTQQLARFQPHILLGECVASVRQIDSGFAVTTHAGTEVLASYVILATGLGPFGAGVRADMLDLPPSVIIDNGHPAVTLDSFQTGCSHLYAIGDAIDYPGKLGLLVSAFHEAALMAFAIRKARAGGKRAVLEYSSTATALRSLFSS